MPVIPQIESQKVYPIAPMSPGAAAVPGAVISRSGQEMQRMGQYGEQVVSAIRHAEDVTFTAQLQNSLDADVKKGLLEIGQMTDHNKINERATQIVEDIQNKYRDLAKNNPRVARAMNLYIQKQTSDFSIAATAKALKEMSNETFFQAHVLRDTVSEKIAASDSEEEKKRLKQEFENSIYTFSDAKLISKEQAYNLVRDLDKRAEEQEVIRGISSSNPKEIQAILDKLKSGTLKHIPLDMQARFQVKGEHNLENINKVKDAQVVNAVAQQMEKEYDLQTADDYAGALNVIPKKILTPKQTEGVENYLLKQIHVKTVQQNLLDEKALSELLPQIDQGKVNEGDIDSLIKERKISTHAGGIAKTAIHKNEQEARQELKDLKAEEREEKAAARESRTEHRFQRAEAKEAAETKSEALFGILSAKIINGMPVDVVKDIYGSLKDGLSWKHANELVKMSKEQVDPNFKLGVTVVDDAFNNKVLDAAGRGKAIIDLRDAVKREGLTGKQIIDKANEIVHPKTKSWIGRTLDKIMGFGGEEEPPEKVEFATGHGPKPTTPKTVPKVGTIEGAYKFKGGDPSDSKNWEKVK